MKKLLLILLLVFAGIAVYSFWPEKELKHKAGILIPENPVQVNLSDMPPWQKDDYSITPLAVFKIKAFVLSTSSYSLGRESDLSPMDLALGWGPMSNQAVIDAMDISQGNRWYHWKAKVLLIPAKEISTHSANMHIIPANERVEDTLDKLYKGCIIEMKGYLVMVRGKDGFYWKSSLTRNDTGGGACEVVWAEDIEIINQQYK
jgi:hypothetical protein